MKSIFDGYLTPKCATCFDWKDGSDGSYGCGTHYPIDWCKAFCEEMKKEKEKED